MSAPFGYEYDVVVLGDNTYGYSIRGMDNILKRNLKEHDADGWEYLNMIKHGEYHVLVTYRRESDWRVKP